MKFLLAYATIWMKFEKIVCERKQAQKAIYCMIIFI